MLTTETRKVEGFSLSTVREEFQKELDSGLLFEKLTDALCSSLIDSAESSTPISMIYSLDLGEFLFFTTTQLTERILFVDENSFRLYDDYLLVIHKISPNIGTDFLELNSKIKDYHNHKDKVLLTRIVQENYSNSLTSDFFESILGLKTKLDDFVAAKEVTSGQIPFRILDDESAALFVEYLFHDKSRNSFAIDPKFYSEEGIEKFNFFKEKLLTKIIEEKTEDLFSIFKPEYFLMFYQREGISLSRFLELFNNLIEEDLNSFHYFFNKDSNRFGDSLSKVLATKNLKELKDDELVRSFKNIERINSLKKTNLEFIGISTRFYYEIIERGIKLEDYSDVKVSFWFLIIKLFLPSQGVNVLKKVPILLYKT